MKSTGVPLAFCQALLALGMAVGIYGFLSWRHEAEEFPGTQYYSYYMVALLTTLYIIMVLGSGLTIFLGDWAVKKDQQVKAEAQRLANSAVSRLNSEFKRSEEGVMALAETRWLPRALRSPNQDDFEDINALLDRCRKKLDASVCYVIDGNGETVASSNGDAHESFVGKNYAGRPYFKQAINGKGGQYFAMGATPGYYVSYPIRDPKRKDFKAVAVVQVTLTNIVRELQSTGEKDNSIICLVDPKGVIFLSSRPDMILASLWPVAEKDRSALGEQYGKDHFTAVFPENIGNGSKVDYKGRPYLVSIAETIHAGWSVFVFGPIEPVSSHRLIGIAVAFLLALPLACLLALLILAVLGVSFYFKNSKVAWAGRFRAIFDQTRSHSRH
jgi:C4-dicarboxylate-specific signal transduction histidine kinase